MDERQWRDERDDRTIRYAARRLSPKQWITITADPDYVALHEGQAAILTAANLLSRMTPSIAVAFPDAHLHPMLPWRGNSLRSMVLEKMLSADPYGHFCERAPRLGDYRLHFGRSGEGVVIHGSGWNSYVGSGPSPIPECHSGYPFGASLATILAVSQVFAHDFAPITGPILINALNWRNELAPDVAPLPFADVGDVWVIGVGSVGTAALYFLLLSGRSFTSTLIDMDYVKRWNLDRSPIYTEADVGQLKVDACQGFLNAAGISDVRTDSRPLHESSIWSGHPPGTPDIVISAANEMNVRYHIETQYPPIQLYGTTGRNWQATLVRHIPDVDACSCCLFPGDLPVPMMACASAPMYSTHQETEPQVDAALPFLSFAAGLMTAVEAVKLSMPGYPFSENRISLMTRWSPRTVSAPIPIRGDCICSRRSKNIHSKMLEGGKYAELGKISSS